MLVSVTFHKVVVAAVFCNYKGNTPTTINIETVRKLNTRIRRTDKKAKQPDDARQQQQQQQRGATTTAERQSNSRRGNAIGNTNVNKPEIQISINFPSLRTHAGAHTRATHIRAHTHTTILAYVAFNFFCSNFCLLCLKSVCSLIYPFYVSVCSVCFCFPYAICC